MNFTFPDILIEINSLNCYNLYIFFVDDISFH